MGIFNSYVKLPEGKQDKNWGLHQKGGMNWAQLWKIDENCSVFFSGRNWDLNNNSVDLDTRLMNFPSGNWNFRAKHVCLTISKEDI